MTMRTKRRLAAWTLGVTLVGIGYYWNWWLALIRLPVSQAGISETSSTG